MSVIIEKFISCDGDGCGENFGVDDRNMLAYEIRRESKLDGWHFNYGDGKDYCPKCWEKLVEPKNGSRF